MSMCNISISM